MPVEHFREEYHAWLEDALGDGIPPGVAAFVFNLYEQDGSDTRFGVEFVGASEFDPDNSDWACAEVWEPAKGRRYGIPPSFCDGDWQICLSQMSDLITSFLSAPTHLSAQLRSVKGIGIGFVDGELLLLRPE